ncbi:MAG TPA: hypothetical protein VFN22_12540 [Gemmatimonadales bacterium]|nr:hypothetical protein [Gemmatimonadales bacterium]
MRRTDQLAVRTLFALALSGSLLSRVAQAQDGPSVMAGAGMLRAFDNTGSLAALALVPFQFPATANTAVRLGAGGWLARSGTTFSGSRDRTLLAVGPSLEVGFRPGAGGFALLVQAHGYWIRSEVEDSPVLPESTPASVVDRPGRVQGIGIGGEIGFYSPINDKVGVRTSLGYVRHAIYPGHSGGLVKAVVSLVMEL